MRYTIVQDDGVVGVDGVFRRVSLSGLDGSIHAIQFDTVKGCGHIEYDPDLVPRPDNRVIDSFDDYLVFIDRWSAAAPPPPPPPLTKEESFDAQLAGNVVLAALVKEMATRLGVTEREIVDGMKSRV